MFVCLFVFLFFLLYICKRNRILHSFSINRHIKEIMILSIIGQSLLSSTSFKLNDIDTIFCWCYCWFPVYVYYSILSIDIKTHKPTSYFFLFFHFITHQTADNVTHIIRSISLGFFFSPLQWKININPN